MSIHSSNYCPDLLNHKDSLVTFHPAPLILERALFFVWRAFLVYLFLVSFELFGSAPASRTVLLEKGAPWKITIQQWFPQRRCFAFVCSTASLFASSIFGKPPRVAAAKISRAGVQQFPAWVCPQKATRPLVLAVGFGVKNSCDWAPTEVLPKAQFPVSGSLGIVLQLILSDPPSLSRTPKPVVSQGCNRNSRCRARCTRAREGRYQLSLVLWAPVRTLPANKCCAVLGSVGLLAPKGRDTSNYRQDPEGRGRKWKEAGPHSPDFTRDRVSFLGGGVAVASQILGRTITRMLFKQKPKLSCQSQNSVLASKYSCFASV